jgi:hypothetical protein
MDMQSFSKNKKEKNVPGQTKTSFSFAFKEWVIANNQAILNKRYRSFLISQTFIDKSFKYHLKP